MIPSIAAVHGGPSVMVERMTRGLAEAGITVHVATTNDEWPGKLDVVCGVPVDRGGIPHWFFDRQFGFYKYSGALNHWMEQHVTDYDIIHIHALFSHSSWAAGKWAQKKNVPYMVRPLGVLNRWGMENRRPWVKRLSFRFVESGIVKNAALMHYTAEAEKVEAAELGVNTPSVVIPNPVPVAAEAMAPGEFRDAHPELQSKRIVLFLSRFDRKKGLELLLPAFVSVRREFPDAALVLAGSGDEVLLTELKAQAANLGIAENITWTGFLQGDDKRAAYADADVFVLPSWSENFGIAVVEAMAAGCPVVVTDQVAIHVDIAQAGAGLVAKCDLDSIAAAIGQVLRDPRDMGNKGKCLTQIHYSPAAVTSKLVAAYRQIVH